MWGFSHEKKGDKLGAINRQQKCGDLIAKHFFLNVGF
jgi:hypothetical protein